MIAKAIDGPLKGVTVSDGTMIVGGDYCFAVRQDKEWMLARYRVMKDNEMTFEEWMPTVSEKDRTYTTPAISLKRKLGKCQNDLQIAVIHASLLAQALEHCTPKDDVAFLLRNGALKGHKEWTARREDKQTKKGTT